MFNIDGIDLIKILLVDDDDSYTNITQMYLSEKGLNVTALNNPIEALELCKKEHIHIILLDYFMPEMTGEEFLKELRKFDTRTLVILQTGYADKNPPLEAISNMSIQGYFDKTKNVDELLLTIISTIKTVNMLLYRENPDTNKIEYNFMSIDENNVEENNEIELEFNESSSDTFEVAHTDNFDIERNGFYGISLVNVSSSEEFEKIKKEKLNNSEE